MSPGAENCRLVQGSTKEVPELPFELLPEIAHAKVEGDGSSTVTRRTVSEHLAANWPAGSSRTDLSG